jgi:lysophospholipase L1-like esterase
LSAKPAVAVVGDSITFLARDDIGAALHGDYDADIQAVVGRRIDEMLPTIERVTGNRPFAIVVNLGSNDALQAGSHPDWRAGFDRMLMLLAPQRCVLVTTINTRLPGRADTQRVAGAINRALFVARREHSNVHVIDWNAAVQTNGSTLLSTDDIHPSPAGQLMLASLIRAALAKDCH